MEAIYKIFDLRKYYPDFVGANPIAVVSDLTEEELVVRCPELHSKAPFVYFSNKQWRQFRKAQHGYGEDKLRKSRDRYQDCYGYQEGISELHAVEIEEQDIMEEVVNRISLDRLREVLDMLPETQRRRILLHYSGYTYAEIAAQENVNPTSVLRSVKHGIKKIIRNF